MTISIEKALQNTQRYKNQDSIFLKAGFRNALVKEYRLEAVDLGIKENAQTVWLPAYIKKNFAGNSLIIGAGFDKTGDLSGLSADTFTRYINQLSQQLHTHNIRQLEVRSKHTIPCQTDHADKVELAIHLDISCAERFKQFSKSTRRNIRLPFRHGFHYILDNQQQQLDDFYRLYLLNIHALGSLPHSPQFFRELWQACRDDIVIFVGYLDDQPVAASFNLLNGSELYGAWGCAHPDYKKYSVFLSMLWLTLEHCEATGLQVLNLGRTSAGSNSYHFKKRLTNRESKISHYILHASRDSSKRSAAYDAASWLIRHSPPLVMHTLARPLLHRFY